MADYQTTVRLDPSIKRSIDALKNVHKFTLNRLMNDALAFYIEHMVATTNSELESSLAALRAYNRKDPDHEAAIARVVEGEVAGHPDPMEGEPFVIGDQETQAKAIGKTEAEILEILGG